MKYARMRDERSAGGPRLSVCITAANGAEADALFEERWRQKVEQTRDAQCGTWNGSPVRTTEQIQAEAMTPAALAVKRNTRGIKE